ncbi:MAG: hypothetical protein QM737_14355 [Ferruginibacter sp.]
MHNNMIGVLVNDEAMQAWQVDACNRLINIEKVIFFIQIKDPAKAGRQDNFPFLLKPVLWFEKKILRSNADCLKVSSVKQFTGFEFYNDNDWPQKKMSEAGQSQVDYIISFASLDFNELDLYAKKFNTKIIQLYFGEQFESLPLRKISHAVINKEALMQVSIHVQHPGGKRDLVHATFCSVENSLTIQAANTILAKCSVLFERFFIGKYNEIKQPVETIITHTHKRNYFSFYFSFIYYLLDKFFFKKQWVLLYNLSGNKTYKDVNSFSQLKISKTKFQADPFVVSASGIHYIFFEELEFKNERGYVSVMEITTDGKTTVPVKIIEASYHLSFPYIFESEGVYYMIPETMEAAKVQLYVATQFPYKWELKMDLLTGIECVDTIVQKVDDTWWMFFSKKPAQHASINEEIHAYYSDELCSTEWKPHPMNPVISDARCGRNAGKLSTKDGYLIRFSQYSGGYYGKAITVSKIVTLTKTDYREEIIETIYPDKRKGIYNLHTFNATKDIMVSDALRRIRRFF